jgi:transposase
MSRLAQNLPRDPDVLVAMVIERDVEIERLQMMLKTANALIHGSRSERSSVVLDKQGLLDLGDLAQDVTPRPANDDEPVSCGIDPQRKTRKKARRNIGFLPKHLPRVEEIIEPARTDCPCCGRVPFGGVGAD